ncbi:hypothetical protein KIN20_009160 [Parelaphostrongylus tenuis]|uniref:Uncharacterized protein n=1 Tax=Parelaphostrongylus tenuis TaxID=148309 RepID=A0AAD5MXG2_PARTN|nr:hypothetical protein KIN20_009160 [Parelaphostrongylus tenuis]
MDLERSLPNLSIDDMPWRSHDQPQQPWASGMPGGGASGGQAGWGHMSPQQMRNPWQDPNALAQGVNDALGIGAAPGGQASWGAPMGAAPGDFGGMNGMMDPPGGSDWIGATPGLNQMPIWSDLQKQEHDGYWKHQQQAGGWGGPPSGMGAWPPRQIHPNAPPPQHGGQGQPPRMFVQRPPQVWPPNGGMMGGPPVGKQAMPWDQQRITGIPRGGMGRGGPAGGRYPPGGMDMSVPPPIDLPLSGMSGMRQMAPPNAAGAWKPEISVAPNGIRGPAAFGQMAAPLIMSGKPQAAPNQFPIGGVDDLMWHDPNGDLKKWQRDTGVSLWGDPEKNNERPVRLWMVGEGEEEDLEVALMKCPVPQKKNEDGTARLPFPIPSKRPIVVTGWGELPENDPNNPIKHDDAQPGPGKWGDLPSHSQHSTDSPWFLPSQQQPQPFAPEAPAWGQPNAATAPMPPGPSQPHTQAVADQLKYAVDKGYLDMSVLQQTNLPPHVLQHMNQMLNLIPALECCEAELKMLVDSVRPDGEVDGNSPQRWMNDVQKVEYNRLIIEVTTVKIEVAELSKKIQRGLADAGMSSGSAPVEGLGSDAYHYSFLE